MHEKKPSVNTLHYEYLYIYMYISIYPYIYICVYLHTHMYTCIYYIYICISIYPYIYMSTHYVYIYIPTYIAYIYRPIYIRASIHIRREVGGWGRDPKKCTGRDWGMGSSTISWKLRPVVKYHLRRGVGLIKFLKMVLAPSPPPL